MKGGCVARAASTFAVFKSASIASSREKPDPDHERLDVFCASQSAATSPRNAFFAYSPSLIPKQRRLCICFKRHCAVILWGNTQ